MKNLFIPTMIFHQVKTDKRKIYNKDFKWTITILMYSRLFGKREFTANIATVDRQKERELLDSWPNSTFDR